MGKKFGDDSFQKGFEVVKKSKSDRFDKKSEVESSLQKVLGKGTDVDEFIGLCSSYILLENYASSMGKSK